LQFVQHVRESTEYNQDNNTQQFLTIDSCNIRQSARRNVSRNISPLKYQLSVFD